MTDSELDEFARRYYADEYRQDLRRIRAMGVEEPDEEENFTATEAPSA